MSHYAFADPWVLGLLAVLPLLWWYYRRTSAERYPNLRLPSLHGLDATAGWRARLRGTLPYLRLLALAALIIALARPQLQLQEEEIKAEGIDIVLAIDLSSSMLAQDFEPNRLAVSKQVAQNFVDNRPYDRIGIVVFAGEAFTQSPLTTDKDVIKQFLANLEAGNLQDGTAIGSGLSTAVNRLKDSEAESKVIILLTDGVNNFGYHSPETAAQLAETFGIRVYTIGVGSTGEALTPVSRRSDGQYIFGFAKVEIDEALLRSIAELTQGRYFRATSAEELQQIYGYIDELETTEIETTVIKRESEEFHPFLLFGLVLLVAEMLLRYTVLRAIP
jgi:Ca-activated chloride channel family protein